MRSRVILPLVVAAVCAHAVVTAQQQQQQAPPQAQTPIFRSQVDLVELDAVVTDASGRVVTDLTAEDFEVLEDGRRQTVAAVSLVNIPIERLERPLFSGVAVEPDVRTNTGEEGRIYVIALDEVTGEQVLRTRMFLRRFIEQHFGANDVGAVVWVGRGNSAHTQDFTSNPRLLLNAIDRFQGGFAAEPAPVPLANSELQPPLPTSCGSGEAAAALRDRMRSLRALAEFMASVRGRRKSLLYVSTGLGFDMFDVTDYNGGVMCLSTQDAHAAMTAATRASLAIYAIDPRGISPDGALGDAEVGVSADQRAFLRDERRQLRTFAELTGGFAFTDQNDFDAAFSRIVRENSSYYVIGFYSTNERRDGRYRRLEVRVRRPGLQVRSRRGYVAPTGRAPDTSARPSALIPGVAAALASPLSTPGLPMRVFAAPFRGAEGAANIAMIVEVDGSQLTLQEKDGVYTGRLELASTAIAAGGRVFPGERQQANFTLKPDTFERVSRNGVRVVSDFSLSPGRYQLRVAAGDPGGKSGSVTYDLEVPDFTRGPLVMSGVALTSTSAGALLTQQVRNPLQDVLPAPAVAGREFTASDTLALYAEIYQPGRPSSTHTVDLRAVLRADDGRVIRTVEERRSSTELQGTAGGYGFRAEIPLADAAPGLYVVRVEAQSNTGDRPLVSRDVLIRVR